MDKHKVKGKPRRWGYRFALLVVLVLGGALAFWLMQSRANNDLDVIFLAGGSDYSLQLYGFDLDQKEAMQAVMLTESATSTPTYITSFDVYGEWIAYCESEEPINSYPLYQLFLLNWRTGAKQLLFRPTDYHISCSSSEIHFSQEGTTIYFTDKLTYPPTVWRLPLSETTPQVFAQYEGISSILWLAEDTFLYHYRDEDHNSHEILYDVTAQTSLEIPYEVFYDLGGIVSITPAEQLVTHNYRKELHLVQLPDFGIQPFDLPATEYQGYASQEFPDNNDYHLAWRPDGAALLYASPDGLFLCDLTAQTIQLIHRTENSSISNFEWNAKGSQIAFTVGVNSYSSNGELWIYDPASQQATLLPALGSRMQWID